MEFLFGLINIQSMLLVALLFLPLERLLPRRREQRMLRRAWVTDSIYFLINRVPISIGLVAIVVLAMTLGEHFVPAGFRTMVADQPLWLQVIELIVVADLLFYTLHRLFHSVPLLWRFHAVHHSIEDLDWLAAHRIHPVDQILTKGASLIPCFALGFTAEAILAFSLIYQWHTLLLHANVRVNIGPLRWLIASPEFHHWHHADYPEAWNRNFGAQLPLWDVLFGTANMSAGKFPSRYGIGETLPASYLSQLLYPFRSNSKDEQPAPLAPEGQSA